MIALIPGSYAPITLGHVDVVERSARMFDRVIVAVMNNDSAEHDSTLSSKQYELTLEERLNLTKMSLEHIKNVEVISSDGLLVELFERVGADVVIRGIRDSQDIEYEMKHYRWNAAHDPRFEVLYLPASEKYKTLSSSTIRTLLSCGEEREALKEMLPEPIIVYLYDKNKL